MENCLECRRRGNWGGLDAANTQGWVSPTQQDIAASLEKYILEIEFEIEDLFSLHIFLDMFFLFVIGFFVVFLPKLCEWCLLTELCI